MKNKSKAFIAESKNAVDKTWPLDPNGNQAKRDNQQNQRKSKCIEFTVKGLKLNGIKTKAHECLIEPPNTIWFAFQTHIVSIDVIYTISPEPVANATTDQNTQFHSLDQQIKELNALLNEQKVNRVNQSCSRHANADNKLRQNLTRFCPYCQKMDKPSRTAELKLTMMRIKDNRHEKTKNATQFSTMIITKKEDLVLGLRTLRILISNPDLEGGTVRHLIDQLAST